MPSRVERTESAGVARRGPGRPPIPLERMVREALEIVDGQGADALTLRSLAAGLRSSTATLYRHFSSRDDLTRQVVDAVFAEIGLDEELLATATWDRWIAHVAHMMFAAMVRHQNVAPLMVEQVPAGPHALRIRERSLTVLLANGFTPVNAVQTSATLARFVLGFAVQLRSESARPGRPATPTSVGSIPLADEFDYGLQLMITGLRVHREQWS